MIQREVSVERAGLVTLTGVEVSADYAHAKVYFTTIGAPVEAAQQVLSDKAGYFHSLLFKRLYDSHDSAPDVRARRIGLARHRDRPPDRAGQPEFGIGMAERAWAIRAASE